MIIVDGFSLQGYVELFITGTNQGIKNNSKLIGFLLKMFIIVKSFPG